MRPTRWTCGYCREKAYTDTGKPPEGWVWVSMGKIRGLRCEECYRRLCWATARARNDGRAFASRRAR